MKLKFQEEPKEWRKSTLLTALGLALLLSLARWRKHLTATHWYIALGLLALIAVAAVLQPRWFRGWYRLSLRLGFYSSQFIGRCVLLLFFAVIITPLGWALRLGGKDPLQLKRPAKVDTYWQPSKEDRPLDRLF